MDETLLIAAKAMESALLEIGATPVIIGGIAASLLSVPRHTDDVDAIIMFDIEQLPTLMGSLERNGFRPRFEGMADLAPQNRLVAVVHEPTGRVVDIMLGCMPFDQELVERSKVSQAVGVRFRLPTPEDLIIMKAIANRPKGREDIRSLAAVYPDLDRNRIRHWVEEYAELMEISDLADDIDSLLDGK